MKVILLSGGSGKRLWPVSNNTRSKQFLKVLTGEGEELESMSQRVYRQLKKFISEENIYISTNKSQLDLITNQLGENVNLIIEPALKDTFPAITLATLYLHDIIGVDENEVIIVLPVDIFVEDKFFNILVELEQLISNNNVDLGLVGVKPNYPASKYGYILLDTTEGSNSRIKGFIEKPNEIIANDLIEKGALWNCGVFAFKKSFMMEILEIKNIPLSYNQYYEMYESVEKNSFDYEVVENVKNAVAIPYFGGWKDLGSWNTLKDEIKETIIGKGIVSDDSTNTILINELDIPIIVQGMKDSIVVASPDGILVTNHEDGNLKNLVSTFENRPMFEERRWGWYRVLDYTKTEDNDEVLTKRICIKKGKNLSYQYHYKRSEVWTIIKGHGKFILDDLIFDVYPGDVLQIDVGRKHAIKAISDIEIIEIQRGSQLIEEDIVRISMEWDEIESSLIEIVK